ncbi:hypothetical protein [Shouchella clausii]|uniref:hypothetical protein n=1 Tax=Shouchella clausii TaxID=79880 RepID=UPI000BA69D57|nr:hypothetical protein [Shouchella clausii]PAD93586.1 hypothetical protein CHH52_03905 [Shouchella clausii]
MGSLFKLSFKEHDKMIKFLRSHYSDMELFSIIRQLNIEKEKVYSRYFTKEEFCEKITETVIERDLSEELLLLLQSKSFFRSSLLIDFSHLGLMEPISEKKFNDFSSVIFSADNQSQISSVEDWVRECKNKLVLILGKDSPSQYMSKLEGISKIVKDMGYHPILIKKQPEVESLTNEEKMLAYAALSRFVLIEKSEPAGQIDEAKICAINRFPAIWIQKENMGDTWMQGDYEVDLKNINVFKYSETNLEKRLKEGIEWVESYLEDKTEKLNTLYPWR